MPYDNSPAHLPDMIPFFSTAKENQVLAKMSDSSVAPYEGQMPVNDFSVEVQHEGQSARQSELVISGRSETAKLTKILRIARNLDEEQSTATDSTPGAEITGVPFNIGNLKEMILNQENKVKVRPILLAVTGLPDSGDSEAISHLLKHHVEKSPYLPMSRKNYTPKKAKSIMYYEVVAVGVHHLQIVEVTNEFSCSFGIMSAFKKKITQESRMPQPTATVAKKQGSINRFFFDDASLQGHLEYLFQHISQYEHIDGKTELTEKENEFANHLKKLPSGTSLINIWNISINTTTLSCLMALSGHLYSSNTWLFLDIERDMDQYDCPLEHCPSEKLQIPKWRPRLHYLLRSSKISHSGESGSDRDGCCTVFARHDDKFNGKLKAKVKELEDIVKEEARQVGVYDLLDKKIQPINLSKSEFPDDQSQHLYQKFYQLICEASYTEIPLSWLFLRSLFYQQREKVIISKSALEAKANSVGITGDSFEDFCRFYMSFGSIIDFSFINPDHKLIVLLPIEFLRLLDKVLQPEASVYDQYPIMKFGIVSEKLCNKLFEIECSDCMDALTSVGLAVKVTGSIESSFEVKNLSDCPRTDSIYYVPQMRRQNGHEVDISVDLNAIYFITSIDSPIINKQAQIVHHILSSRVTAKLTPCVESNKSIIHDNETDTRIEFVSFSPANMLKISKPNEAVYTSVLNACKAVTECPSTEKVKYKFVIICGKEVDSDISPSSILSCHTHILPNEKIACDRCADAYTNNENWKMWNKVLNKLNFPKEHQIIEDFTIHHFHLIAEELSANSQFIPHFAKALGYKIEDSKFEGFHGGKLVMQMLLEWEKVFVREKQKEESTTAENYVQKQLDEGPRRVLARKLLEISQNWSLEDEFHQELELRKFFLKLAKKLDIYVGQSKTF